MPDKSKNSLIICARMGSSRLPGKSLMPLNNKRVIEQVAIQLENAHWPYIFAIPDSKSDDELYRIITERFGYDKVFRGNPSNVTNRIWEVANELGLDNIMRITGDDPCHSCDLINASISEFLKYKDHNEYFSIIFDSLPDGLYHEIIPFQVLDQLNLTALNNHLTAEHVTPTLNKTRKNSLSNSFLKLLEKYETSNLKLSLDTIDDYTFLTNLFNNYPGNVINTVKVINDFKNKK
jgi:spore coat polysaccharide biosynthesis protein SpsF